MSGVLLAFFFLPFLLPFCNLNSEDALPACCRRDGKHHCAMSQQIMQPKVIASAGTVVRAATADCPYRSRLLMPLVLRALFVHRAVVFTVAENFSTTLGVERVNIVRRCEFGIHRKRGPPALLI